MASFIMLKIDAELLLINFKHTKQTIEIAQSK